MKHSIKDIIKGEAHFKYLRQNIAYYSISIFDKDNINIYTFPVPLEDIGNATLLYSDKGIMFMRYIRKAIEDKTLLDTVVEY